MSDIIDYNCILLLVLCFEFLRRVKYNVFLIFENTPLNRPSPIVHYDHKHHDKTDRHQLGPKF